MLSCAVGALLLGSLLLGGCNNPMFDFGGYEYPDFPLADHDDTIDSWTQWEEDEIINIDWFIDSTSYSLPREGSQVMDEILRKTGVKINFRKATTGDGSELTTMIAGNDLPDLVSVTAGMDNLVNGAKVFPIQRTCRTLGSFADGGESRKKGRCITHIKTPTTSFST